MKYSHPVDFKTALQKVQCQICGNWLKPSSMKYHKRYHEDEGKEFNCTECGHMLPSREALRAHVKRHLGITFTCEICGKSFKATLDLKDHIAAVHTGELLYQCEFCAKPFNSKSNMYSHRKKSHPVEWHLKYKNG